MGILNLGENALYSGVSYRQINMEREAGSAAPARREENNRLTDCRTFRMSWQREGRRGDKRFSSAAGRERGELERVGGIQLARLPL